MALALIVAVSENNVIGKGLEIPWKIPEDMKRFKELTINHPVIMGRKTFESIPEKFRPLPRRKNIVLSTSLSEEEGIYIARNIEEALELTEDKDSYIMGGEKVYEIFLPRVNRLEITRVHGDYNGNVFFPKVNWDEWEETNREDFENYSFLTYVRK